MLFPAVSYILTFIKKIWSVLFLLFLILFPCTVFSQSLCDDITMETISRHLAMPGTAKIVEKHDRGSVCEVILRTRDALAPVYVTRDSVLIGQLFQNRQSITRNTVETLKQTAKKEQEEMARQKAIRDQYRKDFFRKNLAGLEKCVAITLASKENPGKKTDPVYIITDPGCSHCKSSLKYLEKLSSEYGICVKIIIYPILGDESKAMAAKAVCQKFSYEDYLEMKAPLKSFSPCKEGIDFMENTMRFLEKADIDSVPVMIGNKASWIVEGNRTAQVADYLNLEGNKEKDSPPGI